MMTDTPVPGRALLAKSGFQSMGSLLVALAITAVFAVDWATPPGVGVPFSYVLILCIALVWATPRQVFAVAAASSVLTVFGLFLSHGSELHADLANCAITLFTLCFLAYFGTAYRESVNTGYRRQLAAGNARLVEETAEHRTTELAAREREELLQATFDSAPVGISMADLDGRLVKVNATYQRMVGYSEEELLHTRIYGLTHPDDVHQNRVLRRELISGKREFYEVDKRYRSRDGRLKWVRDKGSLIRDALGGPRYTILVSQDITGRKLAEEALQESERRRHLVLEDRERLSRDLHDHIVQAIYAIGMQLEACQQRLLYGNPKEAAPQLTHSIGGLNGVMRDVRHYISGSGPKTLSKRQLRAELARLVNAIGATGTLRFRLKMDPWFVTRLTPQQAEHVLHIAREAMSNALQHSHARHAELSLHGAHAGVDLEIGDDGVGFDPGAAARGTGGLHNMQIRARQIGGQLEIRSSPGQGTTITLHIPDENASHGI